MIADSHKSAAECIGCISPKMRLFAVTRGQFSMIDAILHLIAEIDAPVRVSLWPRTVSVVKADIITRLMIDRRISAATLVINTGDDTRNASLMGDWLAKFGPGSIRAVSTHAKIATVEGGGYRFLIRGSLNLGHGTRFEQMDLSEGDAAFETVRAMENSLTAIALQPSQQALNFNSELKLWTA